MQLTLWKVERDSEWGDRIDALLGYNVEKCETAKLGLSILRYPTTQSVHVRVDDYTTKNSYIVDLGKRECNSYVLPIEYWSFGQAFIASEEEARPMTEDDKKQMLRIFKRFGSHHTMVGLEKHLWRLASNAVHQAKVAKHVAVCLDSHHVYWLWPDHESKPTFCPECEVYNKKRCKDWDYIYHPKLLKSPRIPKDEREDVRQARKRALMKAQTKVSTAGFTQSYFSHYEGGQVYIAHRNGEGHCIASVESIVVMGNRVVVTYNWIAKREGKKWVNKPDYNESIVLNISGVRIQPRSNKTVARFAEGGITFLLPGEEGTVSIRHVELLLDSRDLMALDH